MGASDAKRRHGGGSASLDRRIAEIARRQHGLVRLEQLQRLGLRPSTVGSRVRSGRLHRIHAGVFAVGHPLLSEKGGWLAAVLAAGPGALLSHLAAAKLQRARQEPSAAEVSVPTPGGRQRRGFRIHRVAPFHDDDLDLVAGIPCTSLPRTLIDIAPTVGQRGVELAIAEAQFHRRYDRHALGRAVARHRRRRGVGIVRKVLAIHGIEQTLTNRQLEERFLKLARRARFPLPAVNRWVPTEHRSYKCDFVWADASLIIETDGRSSHDRDLQFDEDRRRDAALKLAGWDVVRFTWRQVIDEPSYVISTVRRFRERRLAQCSKP